MDNLRLTQAVRNADIKETKYILKHGKYSIDGDGGDMLPPILECLLWDRGGGVNNDAKVKHILELLLQFDADVDIRGPPSHDNKTAVILAAERGFDMCLHVLYRFGCADLSITSNKGYTALMAAAEQGRDYCVLYLTKYCDISRIKDLANSSGQTALILAVLAENKPGRWDCFIYLVQAGVNLDKTDGNGYTALMHAVRLKFNEAMAELIANGANVHTVSPFRGETLLTLANLEQLELMSEYSGDLDLTLSRRDQGRVHQALQDEDEDLIRHLVMNGFPPLYIPTKGGSPLEVAFRKYNASACRYFILNNFLTSFDVVHLCWTIEVLMQNSESYIRIAWKDPNMFKELYKIFNYLRSRPHSLRTLCLVTISAALSQDFARPPLKTEQGLDKWMFRPTFAERVKQLGLPPRLEREFVHDTPSAATAENEWGLTTFGGELHDNECECSACQCSDTTSK